VRRPAVGALIVLIGAALSLTGVSQAASPHSAPPAAEPASVADELLVGYRLGVSETHRSEARSRARAERVDRVAEERGGRAGVELVKVNGIDRAEAARRLRSNPHVAFVEPNWILTHDAEAVAPVANDPMYLDGSLWGMKGDTSIPSNEFGSQADEAWAGGKAGSDASTVYVGIIDEGYQHTHPDLAGNAGKNPGETGFTTAGVNKETDKVDNDGNGYKDDVYGWDFAGNNNSVYDGTLDDHGTHVAGTIGARGDNGIGVAGVHWNVKLISAKFLGIAGGTVANAVKAVDYITNLKVRNGLNVVATNNSWGGGGFSQSLQDAISRANDANIVFVAAAGNSTANNDTTAAYPANYSGANVISVAAIDKTGALASFSNYGATTVDLGAPGVGIWSTVPANSYASYDGTSMATPHVTGAVALYAAQYPRPSVLHQVDSGNPVSVPSIRSALLSPGTIVPTTALAGKTVTGGRLDVSRLISGSLPVPVPTPPPTLPSHPRLVTVTKGTKSLFGTPITVKWTGYLVKVDIYRNGTRIVTNTTNDGLYTQTVGGTGRMTYKVCDTGKTAPSSCAEHFTDVF
jgi:subtilisin family serine protease